MGSLKSYFLARQLLLLDLICFCIFLDGSHFHKEPPEIVCHAFETFSRGCILLELEMIKFSYNRFLPINF